MSVSPMFKKAVKNCGRGACIYARSLTTGAGIAAITHFSGFTILNNVPELAEKTQKIVEQPDILLLQIAITVGLAATIGKSIWLTYKPNYKEIAKELKQSQTCVRTFS